MAGPDTNRRAFPRLGVFSGNAEITRVIGRGRRPADRARIVNWSRGGLCLRVASPRRKLVFWQRDPALFVEDAVTCTLRLPPAYGDIPVDADVVRVDRCKDDPDVLEVGLRFDAALPADRLEAIARILEPKPRTSARAPAAGSDPARKSARLEREARKSARLEREARRSARLERTSERLERKSARLAASGGEDPAPRRTTERLPRPDVAEAKAEPRPSRATSRSPRAGEPVALPGEDGAKKATPTHSQRLRMADADTLELRGSARQARQSGRLR